MSENNILKMKEIIGKMEAIKEGFPRKILGEIVKEYEKEKPSDFILYFQNFVNL